MDFKLFDSNSEKKLDFNDKILFFRTKNFHMII